MEVQELIDILTAFKEGKTIQVEYEYTNEKGAIYKQWTDVKTLNEILFDALHDNYLRVKPEPKYRPYKNADEYAKASIEHKDLLRAKHAIDGPNITKYIRPSGFTDSYACGITNGKDVVAYNYGILLKNFVWNDDGSPCGVLEE